MINESSDASARVWQAVQIFYYEDNKDDLILDCIRPLLAGFPGSTFFQRHWRQGPHLRVQFMLSAEDFAKSVRPLVESLVHAYLREHPSTVRLDGADLLQTYRILAEREQEKGPLLPLHADNSIQYMPYDRRLHVLGSPAVADLVEDFYVAGNSLVFEILEHVRRRGDRLAACIDLMVGLAHSLSPGLATGFVSYRSHAEAYIAQAARPNGTRAAFDRRYAETADAVKERVGRVVAMLDGNGRPVPFVRHLLAILEEMWKRARTLGSRGDLRVLARAPDVPWLGDAHVYSRFHTVLASDPQLRLPIFEERGAQLFRLMINLLYLLFTRLGVRPVEKYLLCHVVANAVEELYDVDAVSVLRRWKERGPEWQLLPSDSSGR
jgi:hypothetical protein